jgi:hypothetical protein
VVNGDTEKTKAEGRGEVGLVMMKGERGAVMTDENGKARKHGVLRPLCALVSLFLSLFFCGSYCVEFASFGWWVINLEF